MMTHPTDLLVKCGTFLYAGSVRCAVEIWQTNFRPGTGDHEDTDDLRDDAYGTFFEIRYACPGGTRMNAGGGYYDSLEAAVRQLKCVGRDVRWVIEQEGTSRI